MKMNSFNPFDILNSKCFNFTSKPGKCLDNNCETISLLVNSIKQESLSQMAKNQQEVNQEIVQAFEQLDIKLGTKLPSSTELINVVNRPEESLSQKARTQEEINIENRIIFETIQEKYKENNKLLKEKLHQINYIVTEEIIPYSTDNIITANEVSYKMEHPFLYYNYLTFHYNSANKAIQYFTFINLNNEFLTNLPVINVDDGTIGRIILKPLDDKTLIVRGENIKNNVDLAKMGYFGVTGQIIKKIDKELALPLRNFKNIILEEKIASLKNNLINNSEEKLKLLTEIISEIKLMIKNKNE